MSAALDQKRESFGPQLVSRARGELRSRGMAILHAVDFRNFIVFFWSETLAHWNPTSCQQNIHNNLFGFKTLKLKIRRLKLWKPTVSHGTGESASMGGARTTWPSRGRLGKGQVGSATMGSVQISCVLTEGLSWYPFNLLLYSQKWHCVPFSPIWQNQLLLQRPHWCWPRLSTTKRLCKSVGWR